MFLAVPNLRTMELGEHTGFTSWVPPMTQRNLRTNETTAARWLKIRTACSCVCRDRTQGPLSPLSFLLYFSRLEKM